MLLTTSALAVFSAIWMWTADPPYPQRADTLTTHLIVEFDRTITSNVIKRTARNEATAIWKPYGIELLWSDNGPCAAALHLDVSVARYKPDLTLDGLPLVLGRAMVDPSGVVQGPIRISFDAVEQLLRRRASNPVLHDYELGRALGRVLAHELGHVLLGRDHDSKGLMRARLTTEDLARSDRRGVRLSDVSVSRLRSQIAHLSEAQRSVGENEHRTCDPDDAPAWEREAPAPLGSTARLVRSTRLRQASGEAGDCQ
jgi:hypothetical protein